MRSFARWRALGSNEQRLVLGAALAVSVAAAGLRIAGVRRMLRASSGRRRAAPPAGQALSADRIRDWVTAMDRTGRYVPGATCLSKSLALAWILTRRGVAATVRLGVSTGDGFAAHAWVECDGVAVNDASQPGGRYAIIAESSQ